MPLYALDRLHCPSGPTPDATAQQVWLPSCRNMVRCTIHIRRASGRVLGENVAKEVRHRAFVELEFLSRGKLCSDHGRFIDHGGRNRRQWDTT